MLVLVLLSCERFYHKQKPKSPNIVRQEIIITQTISCYKIQDSAVYNFFIPFLLNPWYYTIIYLTRASPLCYLFAKCLLLDFFGQLFNLCTYFIRIPCDVPSGQSRAATWTHEESSADHARKWRETITCTFGVKGHEATGKPAQAAAAYPCQRRHHSVADWRRRRPWTILPEYWQYLFCYTGNQFGWWRWTSLQPRRNYHERWEGTRKPLTNSNLNST